MGILQEYQLININDSIIKEASESIKKGTPLIIRKGIFQAANKKNRNGRVYPREILAREVEKYIDFIREKRSLGELDHPNTAEVNLANASHLVTNLWWEADDLYGEMRILDTPSGNIAKQLIANGVSLGVSSRGVGSVEESEDGNIIVQDDFNLISFDLVSTPSTSGAFLKENREIKPSKVVDTTRLNKLSARILEKY